MARAFVWTPAKEEALRLEFAGRTSQRAMAELLGTTRRTVEGWCRRPAFRARLEQLRTEQEAQWRAAWKADLAALVAAQTAEHVAESAPILRRTAPSPSRTHARMRQFGVFGGQ